MLRPEIKLKIALAEKAMIENPGQRLTFPTTCKTFSQCFVIYNGDLLFYFNDPDNSTGLVKCSIPPADGRNN
jgi:hypothetical protein